jgi:hypothetical protein
MRLFTLTSLMAAMLVSIPISPLHNTLQNPP